MPDYTHCFQCGRAGHWAENCDRLPCPKCLVRMDLHTEAGIIECAWRGHACAGCGHPPHPDAAPGRCARYTHPADTAADRAIRQRTPWRRDNTEPCYRTRGIEHYPIVAAVTYIGKPPKPRDEEPLRQLARRQVDEARAGRLEADGQGVIAASPAPPG